MSENMKRVVVQRQRIQITRAVFEVEDDTDDVMKAAAIKLCQRSAEDPFTGRTDWTYTADVMQR